ncbi:unnamed protein product [Notodromas monacha]|uniref:Uncharacterized protein n=1 Tax=Notodromas monacha TaxID=399045 RepID=A0A7R9GGF1_9CRUS|nr:unnamed protein product [Notodromas monacha]CAG0919886.1 unnamed protein product [Notodromas monacha]
MSGRCRTCAAKLLVLVGHASSGALSGERLCLQGGAIFLRGGGRGRGGGGGRSGSFWGAIWPRTGRDRRNDFSRNPDQSEREGDSSSPISTVSPPPEERFHDVDIKYLSKPKVWPQSKNEFEPRIHHGNCRQDQQGLGDFHIFLGHKRRDTVDSARKSLTWYRGHLFNVDQELTEIKSYLSVDKTTFSWKSLTKRKLHLCIHRYFVPIVTVILLYSSKAWSGFPINIGYAVDIFERAHLTGPISPGLANVIAQVVDLLAQTLSTFVVGIVTRNTQMYIGAGIMALNHALFGVYLTAIGHDGAGLDTSPVLRNLSRWWPILALSIYFACNCLSTANLLHLISGEILPQKVANFGVAAGFVAQTLNVIIVTAGYLAYTNLVGLSGVYYTFAATAAALALFSFFNVEHTGGKSLLELETGHEQRETERKPISKT